METNLIISNMKFRRFRSVRSRDIDVLIQTGSRILKTRSGHYNTRKYIFLESDDHADNTNMFFFEIEAKLRSFAKICKFCKLWSTILNI